ncbi:hypothetical protein C8Q79DRAFT_1013496 [Trametes meyenii]|nr:hypothetical protein C8Q79DRAFT_1013496 [Trametes meyenii]
MAGKTHKIVSTRTRILRKMQERPQRQKTVFDNLRFRRYHNPSEFGENSSPYDPTSDHDGDFSDSEEPPVIPPRNISPSPLPLPILSCEERENIPPVVQEALADISHDLIEQETTGYQTILSIFGNIQCIEPFLVGEDHANDTPAPDKPLQYNLDVLDKRLYHAWVKHQEFANETVDANYIFELPDPLHHVTRIASGRRFKQLCAINPAWAILYRHHPQFHFTLIEQQRLHELTEWSFPQRTVEYPLYYAHPATMANVEDDTDEHVIDPFQYYFLPPNDPFRIEYSLSLHLEFTTLNNAWTGNKTVTFPVLTILRHDEQLARFTLDGKANTVEFKRLPPEICLCLCLYLFDTRDWHAYRATGELDIFEHNGYYYYAPNPMVEIDL